MMIFYCTEYLNNLKIDSTMQQTQPYPPHRELRRPSGVVPTSYSNGVVHPTQGMQMTPSRIERPTLNTSHGRTISQPFYHQPSQLIEASPPPRYRPVVQSGYPPLAMKPQLPIKTNYPGNRLSEPPHYYYLQCCNLCPNNNHHR